MGSVTVAHWIQQEAADEASLPVVTLTHPQTLRSAPRMEIHLPVRVLAGHRLYEVVGPDSAAEDYTDLGWRLTQAVDRVAGVETLTACRYALDLDLARLIPLDQIRTDVHAALQQAFAPQTLAVWHETVGAAPTTWGRRLHRACWRAISRLLRHPATNP